MKKKQKQTNKQTKPCSNETRWTADHWLFRPHQ